LTDAVRVSGKSPAQQSRLRYLDQQCEEIAVKEITLPVEELDLSHSLLGDFPNEAAEDPAVDGIEGIPVKQSE
jgi:hypothetical protein